MTFFKKKEEQAKTCENTYENTVLFTFINSAASTMGINLAFKELTY